MTGFSILSRFQAFSYPFQTIFQPFNLIPALVILFTLPLLYALMHPKEDEVKTISPDRLQDLQNEKTFVERPEHPTLADKRNGISTQTGGSNGMPTSLPRRFPMYAPRISMRLGSPAGKELRTSSTMDRRPAHSAGLSLFYRYCQLRRHVGYVSPDSGSVLLGHL